MCMAKCYVYNNYIIMYRLSTEIYNVDSGVLYDMENPKPDT